MTNPNFLFYTLYKVGPYPAWLKQFGYIWATTILQNFIVIN